MCRLSEHGSTTLSPFPRPLSEFEKTPRCIETGDARCVYEEVLKELRGQFKVMGETCERFVRNDHVGVKNFEVAESGCGDSSRDDTVFLFDWDDTLMPTTFLSEEESRRGFLTLSSYARFSFLELDRLVVSVLKKAGKHGRVVVVTNAGEGWVQVSAARYLPMVNSFLTENKIRIVSARSKYFDKFPEAPLEWKVNAFEDELHEIHAVQKKLNLIVIGDSLSDQYAAHTVTAKLNDKETESTLLKFVKLIDRPSLDQLRKQMSLVLLNIDRLVKYHSAFDICVST